MPTINPRISFHITGDDEPEPEPVTANEVVVAVVDEDEEVAELTDDLEIMKLPQIVKKPRPTVDIFDVGKSDVVDEDELDEAEPEPEPVKIIKPIGKLTKKGVPRKPMSEEHKAKLANARILAGEGRKRAAAERKANREIDNMEKNLIKQKRVKDLQKLKDEIDDNVVKPVPVGVTSFTAEDLEKAQYDAILKYDKLRKTEKQEKKKKQAEENERKELMRKLQPQNNGYRSMNTNGKLNNKFDFCY